MDIELWVDGFTPPSHYLTSTENIHLVPSHAGPEAVSVAFASGAHAKRAMLSLHLRDSKGREGKKMCLSKARPQVTGPERPQSQHAGAHARCCYVSDG